MIKSGKYIGVIIEKLNIIRQEIISKSKLSLTDENIYLEDFVSQILNKVYDIELSNLNEDKANFPGIDLGDKKLKIGFQVTATKSSSKVNETITKVTSETHRVYESFDKLKFFILTEKQTTYAIAEFDSEKISFDWKRDVLDFDDIYKKVMYMDLQDQKELLEYIDEQAPSLERINSRTIKLEKSTWIPNDKTELEVLIEHDFGSTPKVLVMDNEGVDISTAINIKRNDKEVILIINEGLGFVEGTVTLSK